MSAFTDTEQDNDARTIKRMYSKIYAHVETRIKQGHTPARVLEWFDSFYGWDRSSILREMVENTAHSLRREQLELAKEALKKVSDK